MNISTRSKIAIASTLSKIIRTSRAVLGLQNKTQFKRGGINWDLDLSQGIDFAIFLQGGFEPETIKTYKKHVVPGSVVLDIGANIGAHALPLASMVGNKGKVIAFEPTDYAYEKLTRNIELNQELKLRITAIQAMLVGSNQDIKPESIPSSWSLEQNDSSNKHPVHLGEYQSLEKARMLRLDDWCNEKKLDRLDLVKIDVDGYEIDVLKGAVNTLNKYTPIIMMEFMPYIFEERGHSFQQLLELLKSLKYHCQIIDGPCVGLDKAILNYIPTGGSINVILSK
jgi:FkbM family methyltransferase